MIERCMAQRRMGVITFKIVALCSADGHVLILEPILLSSTK